MHDASELAGAAATSVIRPVAQRHPRVLVAAGPAAGAVFAASRPWRWLAKPLLLAGLMQQLMNKVLPHIPAASLAAVMAAQQRRARVRSAASGVQQ